jgi:hypothetical protein
MHKYLCLYTLLMAPVALGQESSDLDQRIDKARSEVEQILKTKNLKMKPKSIQTPSFERDVAELSNDILRLSEGVDELSARVQSTVQELYKYASLNSAVAITAILPSTTSIYSLDATIDGMRVFVVDPREHAVFYDKQIPLYNGPIHKNEHKLTVNAVLIQPDKSFKHVRLDRNFTVAEGENKVEIILE